MKNVTLPIPWFGFAVATRAAIGVGLGLLVSQKMSAERRRAVGWTLVSVGAASTIPIALRVFRPAPTAATAL
jgi:hypothetical protein